MNPLLFTAALLGQSLVEAPTPSYNGERVAMYVAAAADVITTRAVIINGGKETNPLLTPIIGTTPSTLKLVAAKAVSVGLTELAANYHKRHGRHKVARMLYRLATVSWLWVSGFNLRFVWK